MKTKVLLVALIGALLTLSGCGAAESAATTNEENIPQPTPQIIYEEKIITEEVIIEKEPIEVVETIFVEEKDINTTSSLSTSFLQSVEGQYDDVLYLGHQKRIVPVEGVVGWYSQDEDVMTVKNNEVLNGYKEGLVELIGVDSTGEKLATVTYAVTTFNDGKRYNYSLLSDMIDKGTIDRTLMSDASEPEVCRQYCNTIYDFSRWCREACIYYDPSFPIVVNNNWTWAMPGDSVLVAGNGVCCDIANAAAYALQGDYEDMGFIIICGAMGHIYNWFYEDGKYYIFDYTRTIADAHEFAPWENDKWCEKNIHAFDNLEAVKNWASKNNMNPSDTMLVAMYSSMGHDAQSAVYMDYMSDSSKILRGELVHVGFEASVYDNMTIIYENHDDFNFEILRFEVEDIPMGVFTYEERNTVEELKNFFPY